MVSQGKESALVAIGADQDPGSRSIYKLGAVGALIAACLFLCDIVVLVGGGAMPASAQAWLGLFAENRAAALLQLFFTDLVGVALMAPLVFSLYVALRRVDPLYPALAAALAFVGIAAVFATNANYSLIALASQYAAATAEARRAQLLAAAESALALGQGTGALMANLFLECALLLFSTIMLRSTGFGQGIGYLGILAHGLDLAHAVAFLLVLPIASPDAASALGVPLLAIGGTLQLLWYPWVARKLLQMSRQAVPNAGAPLALAGAAAGE